MVQLANSMDLDPLLSSSTLRDAIRPQFHQVVLKVEPYIKNELGIKLDKGLSLVVRIDQSEMFTYEFLR